MLNNMSNKDKRDKKGCEKEIEYIATVGNGWNQTFKTKCGDYMEGEKQFCDKCKKTYE